MENQFTWIPFYKELAQKLSEYENRQGELISLINEIAKTTLITSLNDKSPTGETIKLTEIDPFTFMASFNRGTKEETRSKITSRYKEFFRIQSPIPTDYTGVPMLRPDSCWYFSYDRKASDIPMLWQLFKIAVQPAPIEHPRFVEAFNNALNIKNTGLKSLTIGLFWVNPDIFCSLDSPIQKLLNLDPQKDKKITATEYINIIEQAKSLKHSFPELSQKAWQKQDNPSIDTKNTSRTNEEEKSSKITFETNPIDTTNWDKFSKSTGISIEEVNSWIELLHRKKQIILQGPPGTGKTFVSKLFAQAYIGESLGLMEKVQFHPGYTYEDFIQGYRPEATDEGQLIFKIKDGSFKKFCEKAAKINSPCFFIIDEINRANLSSVFGELMYLLEYRNDSLILPSGEHFHIPENVFIIGTMNTADRSIALMDHALRRRFAFIELKPNYSLLLGYDYSPQALSSVLHKINDLINDKDYHIGHSFFMSITSLTELKSVWEGEIIPYLSEYFFDQKAKLEDIQWSKISQLISKESSLV